MAATSNFKTSLSVVIPNFNHGIYLAQSLDSVVTQSHPPDEIVVIDDASTDNSLEIIRPYLSRHPNVRLIAKSRNCGLFANIQELLPQLQTTHVMFLAADDYLCAGYLERSHALLAQHPEAGFCVADVINLFPDGRQKTSNYKFSKAAAYFPPAQVARAARGVGFNGQGFYHVEAMRRAGGLLRELRWHADHFICWVLVARHGLCYSPEPGTVFRQLDTSFSAIGIRGKEQKQVFKNFLSRLQQPEFADVKARLRDGHILAIFSDIILQGGYKEESIRYFLTPSFVTALLWTRVRRVIRHPIPTAIKQFFRRRGHRTTKALPESK